ncbi:hypothetical protein MOSE0_K08350 [Monosporozyma servazzii]
MLSRGESFTTRMATSNENDSHTNGKVKSASATFKQAQSDATNLPSISNILTFDTSTHEVTAGPGQHLFPEGRYITRNKKHNQSASHETPNLSPSSSSPSSSTSSPLSESVSHISQKPLPLPKSNHKRVHSLESLMNAAEKADSFDPILKDKVTELQNIRNLMMENISFLEQTYSTSIINANQHINESEIYETLKKLQNVSIYLHSFVSEILSSQRMKLIQLNLPSTTAPAPSLLTEQLNIPATPTSKSVYLQQPKLTLLPPLQIHESTKDIRKFSAYKFPDTKSSLIGTVTSSTNRSENVMSDISIPKTATGINTIQYSTKVSETLQSASHQNLQTPQENNSLSLSPNINDSNRQSNVIDTGEQNKIGKPFTLFPKSDNQNKGKSTIITPMSHNKNIVDPNRSHDRNVLINPSFHYYHDSATITPHSSREENILLPGVEEDTPIIISPTGKKRARSSSTSRILTSESGATVGMTKTLKLTNNSLLEKPSKKSKDKEKLSQKETGTNRLELIDISKPFANKETALKSQEPNKEKAEPLQQEEQEEQEEHEDESNKKCFHCQSSETPEWRAGPYGGENICNACGLFYRKIVSKFGEKGGNLLMRYRQLVCPNNRRVPAYIEIPEEYMIKFSKEAGFDQFGV